MQKRVGLLLAGVLLMQASLYTPQAHAEIEGEHQFYSDNWVLINDSVMGGVSDSEMFRNTDNDTMLFTGNLSLANNGGFASTRSLIQLNSFDDDYRVKIKVKGDGRTYQLRFRPDRRMDGYAYSATFQTQAGNITEHEFSVDDFVPVWRGRLLRDVPSLSWQDIGQIGLMLADKREGQFMLEVHKISWSKP